MAAWQMRMHVCACYPNGAVHASGAGEPRFFIKEPADVHADYGPKTPTAKELTWRFEAVHAMSGAQFELYVAGLLRAMGHNTSVLGGSGDQGVDLIVDYFGERVAVQCKNYAKPVGNKPVQEVYTGAKHHGCQQAWVVAPAGFTNGAFELARSVGVKLFAAGAIRAWIGEVDKVASPQPRSESFPPTYPTSKLRRQDSESYPKLLDAYEMELTRLERVRTDVLKILLDTQAHIHEIRRQLDAFEKLGTGTLEQKQRYDQLKARYAQIQEKADQEARKRSHGVGQMSGRRTLWSASEGRPWRASEDPLVQWCCLLPTTLLLVVFFVFSIAVFNEIFLGGSFGEGLVYGLVVIGGAVGLVYTAAGYYS
jgi:restriction system protein